MPRSSTEPKPTSPATADLVVRLPPIEPQTKVAGIVGSAEQVASSLSPAIHNAAFKALEMDWVYLTIGIESPELVRGIRGLAGGGIRGLNVTMPHKVTVVEALDSLSETAVRIGAVNTVQIIDGSLIGHNTDGEGLVRFLRRDAGATIENAAVLLIGAGGSARAVVDAIGRAGAAAITVVARNPAKALDLASLAGNARFTTAPLDSRYPPPLAEADIVINATPVGQQGDQLPIRLDQISKDSVVVDLVYRPAITPLIEQARAQGAIAHSGLGMLLHQAALAFEIWTGVEPPMEAMSAAALAELMP